MNRNKLDVKVTPFEQQLASALDKSVDNLDELTCSRLAAARKRALSKTEPKWYWSLPTGLATAATTVLVVTLWVTSPGDQLPDTPLDDLELLTTTDSLELLEELEFYQWLETEDVVAG
ncbi:MAG: DUF3619 family protein [Sedimenticola sp.]|nr:DUF3619 family protein [Sedimenticola sp.]